MSDAPYPSLQVQFAAQGLERETFALVDTGFDGHLAIPESLVEELPAPLYVRRVRTASGQVVRVPVYIGTVELSDHPGAIDALIIALGDEYLLGLPILNHFKMTFEHGHTLTVER